MATFETKAELEERLANCTSPGQAAGIRTKLAALGSSDPEPEPEPEADDAGQEITAEDLPEGVFDPDSPLTPAEQLADYEAAQSRDAE